MKKHLNKRNIGIFVLTIFAISYLYMVGVETRSDVSSIAYAILASTVLVLLFYLIYIYKEKE